MHIFIHISTNISYIVSGTGDTMANKDMGTIFKLLIIIKRGLILPSVGKIP